MKQLGKPTKKELSTAKSLVSKVNTAIVVSSLQEKAKPLFAKLQKITKITSAAEFDLAGQQAKMLKQLAAEAKKSRDEVVKPIKEGMNKAIEKIDELFRPFLLKVNDIDLNIKLQMSNYLEDSKNKKSKLDELYENSNMRISTYAQKTAELSVTSSKQGAQIRKVWEAVLVDKNKVPRKYLVPDMKMVEADLKAGKKVAGFSWEQVDHIVI